MDEQYDEFGNYIGPPLSSDSSSSSSSSSDEEREGGVDEESRIIVQNGEGVDVVGDSIGVGGGEIVLAEDKEYYPEAEEVYGEDVEAMVEEEDAMGIWEPLVQGKRRGYDAAGAGIRGLGEGLGENGYLVEGVWSVEGRSRVVGVVGGMHHGKSGLVEMVVGGVGRGEGRLSMEKQRQIGIGVEIGLGLVEDLKGKSWGVTMVDCPGHLDFGDSVVQGLRLVDGVIVVVDAAEGIILGTEKAVKRAVMEHLDIVLVITKLDRLVLELRIPPADAWHKLRHIVDEFNDIVQSMGGKPVDPRKGDVAFAAVESDVCFTLEQVAQDYMRRRPGDYAGRTARALAKRFWGDVWFDPSERRFAREKPTSKAQRSFVEFVLEPLYKIYSIVVSNDPPEIVSKLERLKLLPKWKKLAIKKNGNRKRSRNVQPHLTEDDQNKSAASEFQVHVGDIKPLIRYVLSGFFGNSSSGICSMIAQHIKDPSANARDRTLNTYTKGLTDSFGEAMAASDRGSSTPVCAYLGGFVKEEDVGEDDEDGSSWLSIVRIMCGILKKSDKVKILGEKYDPGWDTEEQTTSFSIESICLPIGTERVEIREAPPGSLVLIKGISKPVLKSGTIIKAELKDKFESFGKFRSLSNDMPVGCVRLAIEPIIPSELPKVVRALRAVLRSYPGLDTRVEESGEHCLFGAGELYMDCVLHDLRKYADIEIKVSDPGVPFRETVTETSALECLATSNNGHNKLAMIAEPTPSELTEKIEHGEIPFSEDPSKAASILRESFNYDILAAKSLFAFGPDPKTGPNMLLNEALAGISDANTRNLVESCRESIVHGFSWAVREGPLCDEAVRGVNLRLLDIDVSNSILERSPAQIIPAARRVSFSSILTASPRLLEPQYLYEITCPEAALETIYTIVNRRRGRSVRELAVPGTPLWNVRVVVPVLDSFGMEVDIRGITSGAAYCTGVFDGWEYVPGDPLDKSVHLGVLEVAKGRSLARDCMVKTRRRKGMADEVSIGKYFDDDSLLELVGQMPELKELL